MHRTTIEVDDKVLLTLKRICANEGRKLKHLVLELIRTGLQVRGQRQKASTTGLTTWHTSKAPLPKGIDPADRATYSHHTERTVL